MTIEALNARVCVLGFQPTKFTEVSNAYATSTKHSGNVNNPNQYAQRESLNKEIAITTDTIPNIAR